MWNLKTCRTCADDSRNKSMIFLEHMLSVLQHVKNKSLTPIMWDDMMRDWTIDFLKGLFCLVAVSSTTFLFAFFMRPPGNPKAGHN